MKRRLLAALCLVIIHSSMLAIAARNAPSAQGTQAAATKYDPKRDPERDIRDAVSEAQRTSKRILLVVGGEWCSWCHIMDRYFEQNPKLLEFREQHFVTMKVNFSPENENKRLLSRYPEIRGYPHIFVLDTDGKLLHSQNTGLLESGKSYDLEKFLSFLKRWARGLAVSDSGPTQQLLGTASVSLHPEPTGTAPNIHDESGTEMSRPLSSVVSAAILAENTARGMSSGGARGLYQRQPVG